ncbi:DUF502 domain-containing protein [Mariprofundus erugo]|uniref:DUF502 domain-containing protein n=1 Tax=Mariprofundus erugo TaxID=2528639 RepID=UPI0010FEC3C7|nr:DUF502 domain-containing protein [Mariprofundus erugo]TLS76931.1 DUF502 domain-containing protein [Mariprofundus erugo]
MSLLRRYLLAGVVAMMPLLVVVALVNWLLEVSDKALALLPEAYQPELLLGVTIPGAGIVLALLTILLVGAMTSHFAGRHLMHLIDRLMGRIPLVRTVYKATRQLLEAIFSDSSRAFSEVVLVPFPNSDSMVIGFVTGDAPLPLAAAPDVECAHRISVFIPSTPVPTTGWLLFVEPSTLVHLDISIEEGMKLVLSGGTLKSPPQQKQEQNSDLQ